MKLWPDYYGVAADHCQDVLEGCYDVEYNSSENITILDIGANVGAFARWARTRWPNSDIHCYEPHPVNFFLLRKTILEYRLSNIFEHEVAVANANNLVRLYDNGLNCGEWSIATNAMTKGNIVVASMDAADLPPAQIVKIDTEGAEPLIMERMVQCGKLAPVQALMVEYHSANVVNDLVSLAGGAGLNMVDKIPMPDKPHRGVLKFLRQQVVV